MPEIFISYRREDSSGHAGRIFDCVRQRFGDESVFMDITDIEPGADFTQALDTALSSCRVVLVVIGSQWLSATDGAGRRRLDDPGDHLRQEIVRALARGAHVIPVLVRGAAMPREPDLPDDLRPLARRQAHEVSDSRWSFDTDQLIRIVERDLGAIDGGEEPVRSRPAAPGLGATARPANRSLIRIVWPAAVLLVLLVLIVARTWFSGGEETGSVKPPVSADPGATTTGRPGNPAAPAAGLNAAAGATPQARLAASGEARAGFVTFKVLGGLVNGGPGGPRTLRLFVRTTNVGALYGLAVSPDSFRLIVDGEATSPTQAPSLVLAMQSASEDWVVFPVVPNAGAVILQVGDIRRETAKIPIDLRTARTGGGDTPPPAWKYPVDLAASFEKRVGPLVFNLDGARLEHFDDAVPPLQPEKLLLSLTMRIENAGAQYGTVVSGDLFRLLIDGVPLAPTKAPVEALQFQKRLDAEVVFVMPGTATNAVLQLGPLTAATVKVPVDLSAAH